MAAVGRLQTTGRPARRLTAVAVLVGVTFAGGAAVGLGGSGSNGRDGSTVPGEPTDAPVPIDLDDGRTGSAPAEPLRDARVTPSVEVVSASTPAVDNGRGGTDPAVGPLPIVAPIVDATAVDEVGSIDTDSGTAPRRDANVVAKSLPAESGPIDQDVPGAPTDAPDGADEPTNDVDG